MFRGLLSGWSGALLALSVLIGVLWAGSHRSLAMLNFPVSAGGTRLQLISYRGQLSASLTEKYPATRSAEVSIHRHDRLMAALWDSVNWECSLLGFYLDERRASMWDEAGDPVECRAVGAVFPYWMLLAVSAPIPAGALLLCLRRYRRGAAGRCADCGYDMSDVEEESCPACAALMPPSAPTAPGRFAPTS